MVISEQFFGWLLSLGDAVHLIGPENVLERYLEVLKKAAAELETIQKEERILQSKILVTNEEMMQTKHHRCKQDLCFWS